MSMLQALNVKLRNNSLTIAFSSCFVEAFADVFFVVLVAVAVAAAAFAVAAAYSYAAYETVSECMVLAVQHSVEEYSEVDLCNAMVEVLTDKQMEIVVYSVDMVVPIAADEDYE